MSKVGPGLSPGDHIGDDGPGVSYTAGVQDENGDWTFKDPEPGDLGEGGFFQRLFGGAKKQGAPRRPGGAPSGQSGGVWGRGRGFGS